MLKRSVAYLNLILVGGLAVGLVWFALSQTPSPVQQWRQNNGGTGQVAFPAFTNNIFLGQVVASDKPVSFVSVRFATYQRRSSGRLIVKMLQGAMPPRNRSDIDRRLVQSFIIDASALIDNAFYRIELLPLKYRWIAGNYLIIGTDETSPADRVTVWLDNDSNGKGIKADCLTLTGQGLISRRALPGRLAMEIGCDQTLSRWQWLVNQFWGSAALVGIGLVLLGLITWSVLNLPRLLGKAAEFLPQALIKEKRNGLTRWVGVAALLTLLTCFSLLLVGNLNVRLANVPTDDSIIVYAYINTTPQHWTNDGVAGHTALSTYSTMVNWTPWLLHKYGRIHVELSYAVLLIGQYIAFGWALYFFARAASASRIAAWMTVGAACAVKLWAINMGNWGDLMGTSSYSAYWSLALILVSGGLCLKERPAKCGALLMISSLIHPLMTLCAAAAFGLTELSFYGFSRVSLGKIMWLIPPVAVILAVALANTAPSSDLVTNSELLVAARHSYHQVPWGHHNWLDNTFRFVVVVMISLLGLRSGRGLSLLYKHLALGGLILTLVALAVNWAADKLGLAQVLAAGPLRMSMATVCFCFPAAAVYLTDKLKSPRSGERFLALILLGGLLTPSILTDRLILIPIAGFFLIELIQWVRRSSNQDPVVGWLTILFAWLWIAAGLWAWFNLSAWGIPFIGPVKWPVQSLWTAPLSLTGLGLVVFLWSSNNERGKNLLLWLCLVAVWAWVGAADYRFGREAVQPGGTLWDNYQAQRWAASNTDSKAFFFTPARPWRTFSHRRAIDPYHLQTWIYNRSRKAKEYEDKILSKLGLPWSRRITMTGVGEFVTALDKALNDLKAVDYIRLGHQLGFNYVVLDAKRKIKLDPVYRNDHVAVYQLPKL